MGPLVGSVAEGLTYCKLMEWFAHRRRPLGVELWLVRSTLNACFNVDTRASPAHRRRIYTPATRPVSLKLIGEPERTW